MPAYGKKASAKVGQALHELKTGELRSGTSGRVEDLFKLINLELWMRSVRSDTVTA